MVRNKKRKFDHRFGAEHYDQKKNCQVEEARIDPTYGQRSAIPGLDSDAYFDADIDDLDYDDNMDALSYLRSVRQEAQSIPNLLVAPKEKYQTGELGREIYEDGIGDHRGYYEEGAYVAAPESPVPSLSVQDYHDADTGRNPQLVYFDSLLRRFEALRNQLSQTPAPEAVQSLDSNHPIYLPSNSGKEVFAKWSWVLKNVEPVPVQLATIEKGTAFRLLGMLTRGTMLKRGCDIHACISRWLWGLLAKVPVAGELNSTEISIIRELGKKAVLVGVGFQEAKAWTDGMDEVEADFDDSGEDYVEYEVVDTESALTEEEEAFHHNRSAIGDIKDEHSEVRTLPASPKQVPDNSQNPELQTNFTTLEGGTSDEKVEPSSAEAFEAAKARMLAMLKENEEEAELVPQVDELPTGNEAEESPTLNTRATLDMILTVAGELYGQRDLLEFRQIWV